MGRRRDKRGARGAKPIEVAPSVIPEPEDVVPDIAQEMLDQAKAPDDDDLPIEREELGQGEQLIDSPIDAPVEAPPHTGVVAEADIMESTDGFPVPPPTVVMQNLPPLPPPTSPPVETHPVPLTRERAMAQVEQIAAGYLAVRAEEALHIPEYRKELSALFDTAFEEEWFRVCLEILRIDPSLRLGRAVRLFGCAYEREQIKVCSALLALDSWNFEGKRQEYDALARWYMYTEQPEYVGMLMLKDGMTPGSKDAVRANLKLGASITDAVDTLARARSGRMAWHTFFRMIGERTFEIRARFGGHWWDKIWERWTARKVEPQPFHVPQPRRVRPVTD